MKQHKRLTQEDVTAAIEALESLSTDELIAEIKALDENLAALEHAKIVSLRMNNRVLQTRRMLGYVLAQRRTGTVTV